MLKKAMLGVVIGLAMVPVAAMANMQPGEMSLESVAFNVHGVSDGKNISIVTNGLVGTDHPLVDAVSFGRDSVSLLVMKSIKQPDAVNIHIDVLSSGKEEKSDDMVFLNKTGFQKLSNGFYCQAKNNDR